MNINQLVHNITPEVYQNLKTAVETGKWPDGTVLTQEQKDNSLQLVMAYQSKVLKSTEHFTVGEDGQIVTRSKQELKNQFKTVDSASSEPPQPEADDIARFRHDDL